jgi:uncharacterized damage-inducible protein DinB
VATHTMSTEQVVTPEQLLQHWQGHRRVTRRIIDAFPEKDLFQFSIGGMRPFAALAMEFINMGVPTLRGIGTGNWETSPIEAAGTKAELLRLWDQQTGEIDRLWHSIPPSRFQEIDKAFGKWEGPVYSLVLYVIDNEIHHRGQGTVYLRALGIEPPYFFDRS